MCLMCGVLPSSALSFYVEMQRYIGFFGIVDNIVLINIKNDHSLNFHFIFVDNLNLNKIVSHAL